MLRLIPLVLCCLLPTSLALAEPLDALQAVLGRASARVFDRSRPVTDAELRQIMEAGWNAKTLDGSRPFEFIQIRDPALLAKLAGQTKFAKWLAKAPAAIAVLVRTKESPALYRENGALAVMNMYYKAQELGLGLCFQGTANRKSMKRTLGLPPNLHLLSVVPVGAPLKPPKSPTRVELEKLIWQDRIGKPATVLEGTQPAQASGRTLDELLGPMQSDVVRFDAAKPVEPDKLRTTFEAMRAAPSSKNRQPWRWMLVSDPETKQRIARAAKDRTLLEAPVVAVLASSIKPPPSNFGSQLKNDPHNTVKSGAKLVHFFKQHDAACALANLRLGAESQGLGVRVATFSRRGESQARASLSEGQPVSKHRMEMVAAIGIGYARSTSPTKVAALPQARIHRESFASR